MKAQAILTPAESKKLLAKAVAAMPEVENARKNGLIVIHPSSTTFFLIEELGGSRPEGIWVCGLVLPKGMCISWERQNAKVTGGPSPIEKGHDPGQFPFSWVFDKGIFRSGIPLASLLDQMGPEDVYIKAGNALDSEGKVGVLYVSAAAGTIGKVIAASRRKGFSILLPIGLEKFIPTAILTAAKLASREKTYMAMGLPVGLIPVQGKPITELGAINILSGAQATVIAAGGLGGAEGSISLVIHGPVEKVEKAFGILQSVKGVKLPKVRPTECSSCSYGFCHLPGNSGNKGDKS